MLAHLLELCHLQCFGRSHTLTNAPWVTPMVKKTDSHVRVLRPGESIALSYKLSEFEIVLFRPRHHQRTEVTHDTAADADATNGWPRREPSVHEIAAGKPSGPSGGRARTANGPPGGEGGHAEKKRSGMGHALLRPPASTVRDGAGGTDVEEVGASQLIQKSTGGGHESGSAAEVAASDAPLFFDSGACIFYEEQARMDYVTVGRVTSDTKGVRLKPHLVVLGTEQVTGGYCNYNITRPDGGPLQHDQDDAFEDDGDILVSRTATNNGPVVMAAGDSIEVSLRRLSACSGVLVTASLFSKETSINRAGNVFYMVRRTRNSTPLCLVPLSVFGDPCNSCISLMVRKIRVHGDVVWELVNVSEPLNTRDIKSMVLALQVRGLADPAHFARDYELKAAASRTGDGGAASPEEDLLSGSVQSSGSEMEASVSYKRLSDAAEPERSATSVRASFSGERHCMAPPPNRSGRTFSTLLVDVPRVAREGRRQYNVGRSHVQATLFNGDSSDEDEIVDDAMRAVVPCFANASLVRYESGAYNVGSKVRKLVSHYVDHREGYGLDAASQNSTGAGRFLTPKEKALPFLNSQRSRFSAEWAAPLQVLDRCQADDGELATRPELPPDLLMTTEDKQLAAEALLHRSSVNPNPKKRHSMGGRAGRASSLRGAGGHKGGKRGASKRGGSKSRKKGGGGDGAGAKAGKATKSKSSSPGAGAQRPSSSTHRLAAKTMQSRVSSAKRPDEDGTNAKRLPQKPRGVAA